MIHEHINFLMEKVGVELPGLNENALLLQDRGEKGHQTSKGKNNLPVTLLEVYCEEESQLSHQVWAKGGRLSDSPEKVET